MSENQVFDEIRGCLDAIKPTGCYVACCEGGAAENVFGSLAISIAKLVSQLAEKDAQLRRWETAALCSLAGLVCTPAEGYGKNFPGDGIGQFESDARRLRTAHELFERNSEGAAELQQQVLSLQAELAEAKWIETVRREYERWAAAAHHEIAIGFGGVEACRNILRAMGVPVEGGGT